MRRTRCGKKSVARGARRPRARPPCAHGDVAGFEIVQVNGPSSLSSSSYLRTAAAWNKFLHRIGATNSSDCSESVCHVSESVDHFLFSCRRFTNQRATLRTAIGSSIDLLAKPVHQYSITLSYLTHKPSDIFEFLEYAPKCSIIINLELPLN